MQVLNYFDGTIVYLTLNTYLSTMTIGEQVFKARTDQKLSQSDLHHKAGISLDTLRRIEKDRSKNPSHFVIISLEKALNIKFKL